MPIWGPDPTPIDRIFYNDISEFECKRRSNNPSLKRPDVPVAPE